MSAIKVKSGKKHSVKVISSSARGEFISKRDAEMDARAAEAVKTAVGKAVFCNKPIAKYDTETKRAYVEYANGVKKYVD